MSNVSADRTLELRSRGVVRTRFELCESEHVLVHFRPGRSGRPLQLSVAEPVRVQPLLLLICCLVVLAARDSS
jgi:hypothetical protein